MLPGNPATPPVNVRCAIYTRKSTEEGLSQEFNSLDAQRECGEAYIQSQRPQGWEVLPKHYDDGGFTGANLARPALKRLLTDIAAGEIDCVVIYKVDRLSRSLFDFARLMQIFDQHQVSFVSVTQQFNSSTPMGRLTLHILLSFAQFERELVSERTRDKVSAARKKGKWMGGCPVLGYDPDSGRSRLVVNEEEAHQVREIFEIFVRHRALIPTLEQIQKRGWRLKSWTTRKGEQHAGSCLDRHALVRLLSNALYVGEMKYKGEIYRGEQPAIVERKIWKRANELLEKARRGGDGRERKRSGALLRDVLVCAGCGKKMVPGYTTKKGRRYSYYVCLTAQKRGVAACPGGLVSGQRIETAVAAAFYALAGEPGGEPLRQQLPAERAQWAELGEAEQQRIVAATVEQIGYDRRAQQGLMRLRAEVAGEGAGEVAIQAGKRPLVQQTRPQEVENPSVTVIEGRLPRITKLMALAIRFEDLLRQGIATDYAGLARLGGVSRSRITQILNLRNLAPVLQDRILQLPQHEGEDHSITEGALRQVSGILDWREQIARFNELCVRGS